MKKLYIIGNGFDLHHRMKTSYDKFQEYITGNHPNLLEVMEQYYDIDALQWSEFEKELATFDPTILQEKFADEGFEPDFASDDFRDADWYNYEIAVESELDPLKDDLQEAFTDWINSQGYPSDINSYKIDLDTNAHFLNFNYTTTLEDIYQISEKQVFHIHGKANSADKLVFGHAVDPENWRKVITPEAQQPEGLSEEEIQEWIDEQSSSYSHSYDLGINAIISFFEKIYKNTETVIANNHSLFDDLSDLQEIMIYGHSIDEVDKPYYDEICEHIDKATVKWTVYYHSAKDRHTLRSALVNLGIPKTLVEMKYW